MRGFLGFSHTQIGPQPSKFDGAFLPTRPSLPAPAPPGIQNNNILDAPWDVFPTSTLVRVCVNLEGLHAVKRCAQLLTIHAFPVDVQCTDVTVSGTYYSQLHKPHQTRHAILKDTRRSTARSPSHALNLFQSVLTQLILPPSHEQSTKRATQSLPQNISDC